jgi:hypothetical protein
MLKARQIIIQSDQIGPIFLAKVLSGYWSFNFFTDHELRLTIIFFLEPCTMF